MSEYDRRTGVKQLRVRGLKAVKFCAALKALGVNIFRAAGMMPEEVFCEAQEPPGHYFSFVKELFYAAWFAKNIFLLISDQL